MLSEVFFDVETKKLFGDIEGFNPADLGVSIVSVYSRKIDESFSGEQNRTIEGHTVLSVVEGKMQSFWEKDFDESPSLRRERNPSRRRQSLWRRSTEAKYSSRSSAGIRPGYFAKGDKMWPLFQSADRIIGFNSLGFDIPALSPYTNFPFQKLPHFDIMQKVKCFFGHRIALDAIAKETLDREKTDVGINAVYYWQKGDKESLEKLKKYCEADVLITRDIYDYALQNGHLLLKDKWNTLQKVEVDFSYPKDTPTKQAGLF